MVTELEEKQGGNKRMGVEFLLSELSDYVMTYPQWAKDYRKYK
jgi:hypothetical protein